MKKLMVLMFVSFLSLAGCGGGDGVETTAGIPNESPNVISNPVVSSTGSISVNFEPQETPRALISSTGWIRNHARLVVRKMESVGTPVYNQVEVCNEAVDYDDCWFEDGETLLTTVYADEETFKKISDSELDEFGAGTVNIAVPPGVGYSLEVLTYFSDKTGQAGANATPSNLNYILQYAKNHAELSPDPITFDIASGGETKVFVTLDDALAQLVLPSSVLANSTYQVSVVAKSEALRDTWKVRQTLDEAKLGSEWFTAFTGDLGVSGMGAITLTAPLEYTSSIGDNAPDYQLWHHGQFFISDHLLGYPGDDAWSKWTFGANNAGLLNPVGSVKVVLE